MSVMEGGAVAGGDVLGRDRRLHQPPPPWRIVLALLRNDFVTSIATLYLLALAASATVAPLFINPHATKMNLAMRNRSPYLFGGSSAHLFGTDPLGRDLLARVLLAARVSLGVAAIVVVISVTIGTVLGAVAGFYGGIWDDVVMRVVDVFMGFPSLLLVIVVIYALGPGIRNLAVVLIATRWMLYTRVARAEVLKLRRFEYVEAAQAMGASDRRILVRHVLPNLISTLVTLSILEISAVVLTEAGLSFLGLGVSGNSWGHLIAEGQAYIGTAWWLVTVPGLMILLTTTALTLLSTWMVVFLDPTQRAQAIRRAGSRPSRLTWSRQPRSGGGRDRSASGTNQ